MSRQFSNPSGITTAVGSAGVLAGAWTFAAIMKRTSSGTYAVLALQASGSNHRGGIWLTSTGELQVVADGIDRTFGITTPLNVWALVAVTKSAGNQTPRGHMYRYDTGIWTHANSVTGTLGNDSTAIVNVELARSFSDWYFTGLMANAGVWNRALSDADVEGLELALQAWVDSTPVALWPLNQASTADPVQDIIGAADQTSTSGTSVSADEPAGWSYTLGGGTTVVTKSVSTTWNTAAVVTDPVATTWNVASVATKPVGSTWNVAGQVVKNTSTTWDLAGSISKPVATSWGVTSTATKPVATSWDVEAQGQVSRSVASSWGVNAVTSMSAATTWSVATQAALSVATAWGIAAQVAKNTATGWSVEGSATAGLIVRPDTGTVTRPDTGTVVHILTVVVRLYTGTISRP